MNQAEIKIYVDSGSYILLGKYTWCPQSSPSLQHHNVQLRFSSSGQFIHRQSARIFSTVNERGEDIHIGISIPGQGQEQTSPDILSSAVND